MSLLGDTYRFVQFAFAVKAFLRQPMTVTEATAYIRERMQVRDRAFLHISSART